ncbi:hypothetical protein [uncultured Roseobacter sp.]|uniref:hypothetical protein n=1 Tax=uncultured Roseobacter sp. TaxID=114847 RepID=UPI00262D2754|nr:hypothetical protein [uncultured Roseobacter sp.]
MKILGKPNRPPMKLGVKLRARIGDFIASMEVAPSRKQLHDVCTQIAQEPVLDDIVTMFLETQLHGRTMDPLVAAPDEIVDELPCLFMRN